MAESSKPKLEICEALNKMCNKNQEDFTLALDRKVRPTIVAVANNSQKQDRQDVGPALFTEMVQTLINTVDMLIPEHRGNVYITYSKGGWQQTGALHIKAHLTADAFIELLKGLYRSLKPEERFELTCDHDKTEDNVKALLTTRSGEYYRGAELREHGKEKDNCYKFDDSHFSLFYKTKLSYPLLGLQHTKSENPLKVLHDFDTSKKPINLADGLHLLETYVYDNFVKKYAGLPDTKQNKEKKGFAISMVLRDETPKPDITTKFNVYVAAVVYEGEFATFSGKDEDKVRSSWKQESSKSTQKFETKIHDDDFRVKGSETKSSAIASYWYYIEAKKKEREAWLSKKAKYQTSFSRGPLKR